MIKFKHEAQANVLVLDKTQIANLLSSFKNVTVQLY